MQSNLPTCTCMAVPTCVLHHIWAPEEAEADNDIILESTTNINIEVQLHVTQTNDTSYCRHTCKVFLLCRVAFAEGPSRV
jgi:hypothetical protein